jgi:hypothetical protein
VTRDGSGSLLAGHADPRGPRDLDDVVGQHALDQLAQLLELSGLDLDGLLESADCLIPGIAPARTSSPCRPPSTRFGDLLGVPQQPMILASWRTVIILASSRCFTMSRAAPPFARSRRVCS